MFFANNITQLPDDIFGVILDKIEDGNDIYNFKNTCKTFNNNFNEFTKPLNVNLFKIKYKIVFDNCDINKHSLICKKMSIILDHFDLYQIHFNRTHNSCKSIFDTQTIVYISMLTDNVNEHKTKLFKLMKNYNLTNYFINYKISIYFTETFINNIINNYHKNNNDIIINNISLQKLNDYKNTNTTIYKFTSVMDKNIYEYELENKKLCVSKREIINFLIKQMKKIEKEIEKGVLLMENSFNETFIKKKMDDLDNIVNSLNKCRNMMIKLEKNILKNSFGNIIIRNLETDFVLEH
jgi:hypothetical protein